MQPHQQRVVDELKELTEKTDKLQEFIEHNEFFKSLDFDERSRLSKQFVIMRQYKQVLEERISNFK